MLESQFVFRGGHLCLDFLNTEIVDSAGCPRDLLKTPADFAQWSREVHQIGAPVMDRATQIDIGEVGIKEFESTIRFRAALRELTAAVVEARSPSEAALGEFNAVLRLGAGFSQLQTNAAELVSVFQRTADPSRLPPTLPIAEAAVRLLSGPEAGRIRRCEANDCILFFLDTSKNHSRRWCSMEACGNRSKAAAHYHRQRDKASVG